jgi:hypothetical protein
MNATIVTIRCKTCDAPVQVLPGGKRLCGCGAWVAAPSQPKVHLPWPLLLVVVGVVLGGVAVALAVMEHGGAMFGFLAGGLVLLLVVVTFVVIHEIHKPMEEEAEEEPPAALPPPEKPKVKAKPVTMESMHLPFDLPEQNPGRSTPPAPRNSIPLPFDAYQGREPFLFASYAHQDATQVYPEIGKLHGWGYRVWYDEGICPGQEWPEAVAEALTHAAFFLVFVSPRALASNNVRNEINLALKKKKPFLAIYLEETELPGGIELQIGSLQAIMKHLVDEERYHRRLTISLPPELRRENDRPLRV